MPRVSAPAVIAATGPVDLRPRLSAGHTDTGPCDPERWTGDPFTLREADGRFVGLGAADMKGFLALAVTVAASVPAAGLRQPLVILDTADEESTMEGARGLEVEFRSLDPGRPPFATPASADIVIAAERLIGPTNRCRSRRSWRCGRSSRA
jgi:acetylornithine deacetylase/succinyl-diaminopimelate desuccinylase-like protein